MFCIDISMTDRKIVRYKKWKNQPNFYERKMYELLH